MKLDKRIINGKRPLTCFDIEEAEKYVDTKGYFTNDIDEYGYLDDCYYGTLNVVDNNSSRSYLNKDFSRYFRFFLPEEFVKQKEVEKKYRPYTLEEFCNEGFEIVVFRDKKDKLLEYHIRYNGYTKGENNYLYIILGNACYTLSNLFKYYEYLDDDGEWKPFGVEE